MNASVLQCNLFHIYRPISVAKRFHSFRFTLHQSIYWSGCVFSTRKESLIDYRFDRFFNIMIDSETVHLIISFTIGMVMTHEWESIGLVYHVQFWVRKTFFRVHCASIRMWLPLTFLIRSKFYCIFVVFRSAKKSFLSFVFMWTSKQFSG